MINKSGDVWNLQAANETICPGLRHLIWLVPLVLAITSLIGDLTAGEFKVGVGRRMITPNPLLPVSGGLGPSAPAREKQGELMARAVVFQNGETSVAVVSLDLLGFPSVLCDRVRTRVPRIAARNILIGSSSKEARYQLL